MPGIDILSVGDILHLQAQVHGGGQLVSASQIEQGVPAGLGLDVGAFQVVVALSVGPGRELELRGGLPVHARRYQVAGNILDLLAARGGALGSGSVMRACWCE